MLLTTKLHIPLRQHALVARPRLLDKLARGLASRLTILASPPGFGKTTLLTQWLTTLRGQTPEIAAAWLALDEGDNDPARFFAYLAAAVHSLCTGDAPGTLQPVLPTANADALITALINRVTAAPGCKVLVLDDYHVLHTPALHQAITFLVEHMPPSLHLVISTRADPPLPLARWRARRELTEVREADLRFRGAEVAQFLTATMGLALTTAQVTTLEQCTEGWIAGLQLAALSMQDAPDVTHRVARVAGTHVFIGDYLTEEVLQRQPPDVQHFLFATSILRRLCGGLCDALTGRSDGAQMLAALERAQLFLLPLDAEHVWYRYHPLFAELLYSRLLQGGRDPVQALHRRAAAWHLDNGTLDEAIDHALAADAELAADLLETHRRTFQQRGEYVTLARWLEQIPGPVLASRPQLCLLQAKTRMFLHEVDAAEAWLARTRQTLEARPELDPDASILTAALLVQCDIAVNRCELARAVALAQEALALIPPERTRQRAEALMLLGVAHYWRSDYALAHAVGIEGEQAAAATGDRLMMVYARGNGARALYQLGRLREASAELVALGRAAARRGEADLPLYAGWHLAMAEVACEWNDLEAAYRHVLTSQALAEQARNPRTLLHGHTQALRILPGMGRLAEAQALAAEAETLIDQVRLPRRMVEAYTYAALRLALATGDHARIAAWLTQAPDPAQTPPPGEEQLTLLLARVWAYRGHLDAALELLARLQPVLEARAVGRLALETQICRAVLLAQRGAQAEAAALLVAALARAADEGFVRIFVDEGEALRGLLAHVGPRLGDPGLAAYAARLLQAFPAPMTPALLPLPRQLAAPPPGQEPLSPRELEVLRLVARGLSDRDVAAQLVVVTGTVKRHLSNIYDKLGVRSRTQALARARALGWLTSEE